MTPPEPTSPPKAPTISMRLTHVCGYGHTGGQPIGFVRYTTVGGVPNPYSAENHVRCSACGRKYKNGVYG